MPTLNDDAANAQANQIATDYSTASLVIYSGTAPANASTALSGNTALATHTLAGFGAASGGVITANAIADDTIDATGTATFARITAGTKVMQLTLGTSGTEVVVSTTSYSSGGTSSITSLTITQPKA